MSEQNILSKTLSETNPNLFFNPVFQNYYLRLFYDVLQVFMKKHLFVIQMKDL